MPPLLNHLLRYHFFIALCAVVYTLEVVWILDTNYRDLSFYTFIYFATFAAYNIYYISDAKRHLAKPYTLFGLTGAAISLLVSNDLSLLCLSLISILSSLYLFPIVFGKRKTSLILWIRLAILALVWTLTTTLLPLCDRPFGAELLNLFIIRFLFIWNISLLFLIRDEAKHFKPGFPKKILIFTLLLQCMANIFYSNLDPILGLFFLFMNIIVALVSWISFRRQQSEWFYLGVVDGLMLLEAVLLFIINIQFLD